MEDYRDWMHRAADFAADYREGISKMPVRSQVEPGDIRSQLAASPPMNAEDMETIFADFERIVPPGITHWQHPRFFAYFTANAAPISVVAETLVNSIGAQCMLWQTSPVATEMEQCVVDWLRQALDLPDGFEGVIQDSASSSTLSAVLTARERALEWSGNKTGLSERATLRYYASDQAHSSIDRALWVAGIGQDNLVRIPTKGALSAMDADALEAAIQRDIAAGFKPACVIANVGGTSVGATDDVAAIIAVAKRHDLFVHVDAAWAGSAMICPEFRDLWRGTEEADSIVFNPHKWLGAQFDCSVQFLKNPIEQLKTLSIQPEYLKTPGKDDIVNFSEWTIPLGRRFRALKLWFLMRGHGITGLQTMIRNHVAWSQALAERLGAEPDFEITSEPMLSLFSFRYIGSDMGRAVGRAVDRDENRGAQPDLDALNLALVGAINDDGRIYLTQTRHQGALVIRFTAGQFECKAQDFDIAFNAITECARDL